MKPWLCGYIVGLHVSWEAMHAPGFPDTRVIKTTMDEANNQIELACIRMFKESAVAFGSIDARAWMRARGGSTRRNHDMMR